MSEWYDGHLYLHRTNEVKASDIGYDIELMATPKRYLIWYGGEYDIHCSEPNDLGLEENKRLCVEKAEEILLELLNNVRSLK